MQFQLSDILKAIGPSASIIFAAWIFLSLLQTRYDSAIDRYKQLVETYRGGDVSEERAPRARDEIKVYARRCQLMSRAVNLGLTGAILLVTTIIFGEIDVLAPKMPPIQWIGAATSLVGLSLVIFAACLVLLENAGTKRQLHQELEDLPDLSEEATSSATKLAA